MKLINLFLALMICSSSFSQEDKEIAFGDNYYNKTTKGFLINKNWEKIPCEIQLNHPALLGDALVLLKKADGRATWYPNDLTGFFVNGDFWLAKKTGLGKLRYCLVENDGSILTYKNIVYIHEGDNKPKRDSKLQALKWVEKEGGDAKMWSTVSLNVKKHLGAMVADNSEMTTQVMKEDVTITDGQIEKYILVYNEWYLKQHADFTMRKNRAKEKSANDRIHPIEGSDLSDALSKRTKEKKETLAEKVNKYDKIPVYFMKKNSNVQCSAYGPNNVSLAKEEWFQPLDDDRKNAIYNNVIAEMNFLFKTDKFVDGGDFPGKKTDWKGEGILFSLQVQIYSRYEVSELDSKQEYPTKYQINSNLIFKEVNEKDKLKNVGKVDFFANCKKKGKVKYYGLSQLKSYIKLDCPVDVLKTYTEEKGATWIKKQFPNG